MAIEPGKRIGPYEVTPPRGEGGMGVVYLARDTKLKRDVALKLLPDLHRERHRFFDPCAALMYRAPKKSRPVSVSLALPMKQKGD